MNAKNSEAKPLSRKAGLHIKNKDRVRLIDNSPFAETAIETKTLKKQNRSLSTIKAASVTRALGGETVGMVENAELKKGACLNFPLTKNI